MEEYLRSQSGEHFAIEHVEKLTSEYVMGREHDGFRGSVEVLSLGEAVPDR